MMRVKEAMEVSVYIPCSYSREDTLVLLRRVDDIPTLPNHFFRIREVIEDGRSDSKGLAQVIGADQATAAMVLKVANSFQFSPEGKPIGSLERAIARIGFKETAHIAMMMSLFYGLALRGSMRNIQQFWVHAYTVAVLSKQLAEALGLDAEEMFMAGLLHDIGRAMLGIRIDMFYFESELGRLSGDFLIERELAHFGLDHAAAGAETMALWHFPPLIIQAVKEHHAPDSCFMPARLVSLANREAHKHLPDIQDVEQVQPILSEKYPKGVTALLKAEGFKTEGVSS